MTRRQMSPSPSSEPQACPICREHAISKSDQFWDRTFQIWQCRSCKLQFVWPQPSEDTLARLYQFNRYAEIQYAPRVRADSRKAALFDDLLERVRPSPHRPASLLDVGCSIGKLLGLAGSKGWSVEGIERDPSTAMIASRRLGISIHVGADLRCLTSKSNFDVIVFSHILEHVRDPLELLFQARSHLAERGKVLIRVPNSSCAAARLSGPLWTWYCPPVHLYYFEPNSLKALMLAAGFISEYSTTRHGDARSFPIELISSVLRLAGQFSLSGEIPVDGESHGLGFASHPKLRRVRDLLDDALSLLPVLTDDEEVNMIASQAAGGFQS